MNDIHTDNIALQTPTLAFGSQILTYNEIFELKEFCFLYFHLSSYRYDLTPYVTSRSHPKKEYRKRGLISLLKCWQCNKNKTLI